MAAKCFSDVLSKSINDNMKNIYLVVLVGGLYLGGKVLLHVYNHSRWSGMDEFVPGVFNPN